MASSTFEMNMQSLQELLAKPPASRKDFEIRSVIDWLRTRVNIFRKVKDSILIKLVKECRTVTKEAHDVVIREGDIGDCMYILMSGFLHIYRRDPTDGDEERRRPVGNPAQTSYPDRSPLGEDVVVLSTAGAVFGEVALIEDIPRTASVIADSETVLLVVDRDLYDRTVRSVIEAEFQAKLSFINNNPLFRKFNFKYKNQLAMALEVVNFEYDGMLIRQGQRSYALFFILQGEVRITACPLQHQTQFPHLEALAEPHARSDTEGKTRQRRRNVEIALQDGQDAVKSSSIGDMECLMGLDTFVCTATATQNTTALRLTLKSFDRMITKKCPQIIPQMRAIVCQRLDSWLPRSGPLLPLLDVLRRRLAREGGPGTAMPKGRTPDVLDPVALLRQRANDPWRGLSRRKLVLPKYGPLIDQTGPGTVFHYIRARRQRQKISPGQRNAKRSLQNPLFNFGVEEIAEDGTPHSEEVPVSVSVPTVKLDPPYDSMTSDSALNSLEVKLREFLHDSPGRRSVHSAKSHVVKLARYNPEDSRVLPKGGYVVMMRPRVPSKAFVSSEPASPNFRLPQLAAALSSVLRTSASAHQRSSPRQATSSFHSMGSQQPPSRAADVASPKTSPRSLFLNASS